MGTMTTSYAQDAFEGTPVNKPEGATKGLTPFSRLTLIPKFMLEYIALLRLHASQSVMLTLIVITR